MLAGSHPPTGGRVTVGEVPLVDLPLDELRSRVALVTQEHHVFVGTIAENLLLAKADAELDDLWQALRAVESEQWVRDLEAGIETRSEGASCREREVIRVGRGAVRRE